MVEVCFLIAHGSVSVSFCSSCFLLVPNRTQLVFVRHVCLSILFMGSTVRQPPVFAQGAQSVSEMERPKLEAPAKQSMLLIIET